MPWTRGCLVISMISLMGLPFLRGFYSKDLVIEGCLRGAVNLVVFLRAGLGVISTVVYSGRVFFKGVCGISGGGPGPEQRAERGRFYESFPRVILALGTVFGGWFIQQ